MNVTGMSREELEREARRIGVIAPERLGRHALERRIREHHASPLRRARRAFRGLVGFAKAIAGAPPSLPKEGSSEAEAAPSSKPARPGPPAPKAERRAPKAEAEDREPKGEDRAPKAEADREPRAESRAPKAGADDDLADEPIPTRTMAKLLAEQGHGRRALAIYRKLLRESPGDEDLRQAIDRLEASRGRGTKSQASAGDTDDDESEGVEVVALPVGEARVLVAWSIAGPALEAAEAMVDDSASLEARVVVVRADSEGAIRREVRERPADPAGEWVVPVYEGARVTAAVGLSHEGRFVSVAHAPVIIA